MRTRTSCVAAALLFISVPAPAQTVLSEADALARLSPDSPRVKAMRAGIDVARADVVAAGRWPNPRLTFNRESVAGVSEHMFLVSQPLPITGRRDFEVSAASALVEAQARRAEDEVRRARAELRSAYADLLFAQTRESELTEARDRLRGIAEALARREAAGDAAGYDRLRAEREVMDLDSDRAVARADRARAQVALAAFFGRDVDATAIVAVPGPGTRTPVPEVPELVRRAEMVRGEPAALQHEIESARFAEQAAGRRSVPEPELVVGTKMSNAGGRDVGGVIGVHMTLAVFDRAQPEKALAQARVRQAEARAEVFRSSLTGTISALRTLVAEQRDAADRYRTASSSAAALERIAQVRYDAGEQGILELLDAYRSGATARMRQATLDAALRQAEIELEFVSGWELQ